MKLDLCSGGVFREGYTHVDKNPDTKPDVVVDISKEPLPFDDESVEEVMFFHGIEHIERERWDFVFKEIRRVLRPLGKLVLGYPEFRVCAENFVNNKGGGRGFWHQTIYGRKMWPGDEHVSAVDSVELKQILESYCFLRVHWDKESEDDYYYSVMVAFKDPTPQSYESVMAMELRLPGEFRSIKDV